MKQQSSKEKLLDNTESMVFEPQNQKKSADKSSKDNRIAIFLKLLISYQLNYESLLRQIDKQNIQQILQISRRAPGYKSLSLIFCYYLKRGNIFSAFTVSLLFPIPLSVFVYYLGIFINSYQDIGQYLQIGIIGLRCCVISYLLRYCLHFPEEKFYWIIYFFSILIGLIFNHNYVFILIYVMGIFLSIYKKEDVRNSTSIDNERMQEKQLSEQQKNIKIKFLAHPQIALYLLIGFFIFLWILGKFFDDREYGHLKELFVVGLLSSSQQTSIFFPAFATKFIYEFGFHKRLMIGDLYALGFIIPGLHLKSYMLLLDNHNFASITLSFIALHLPTLLLIYVFLGYRPFFYSVLWRNIAQAMQSVSNGLILVTVIQLIREQTCHFNIVFYTSIVLFTVTKLYRLNQIISAILGIFLVASRASVLHFSNKVKIQNFLCWTEK